MRITALSTAGVLIKSHSTGNYSFMYASQYFLSYKREDDKTWRRYHKNDVSVTVRYQPFFHVLCFTFIYRVIFPNNYLTNTVWCISSHRHSSPNRKLPTYPSPKPTFCPKWEVSVNVPQKRNCSKWSSRLSVTCDYIVRTNCECLKWSSNNFGLVKEFIISHQTGVHSLDIKISVFFL